MPIVSSDFPDVCPRDLSCVDFDDPLFPYADPPDFPNGLDQAVLREAWAYLWRRTSAPELERLSDCMYELSAPKLSVQLADLSAVRVSSVVLKLSSDGETLYEELSAHTGYVPNLSSFQISSVEVPCQKTWRLCGKNTPVQASWCLLNAPGFTSMSDRGNGRTSVQRLANQIYRSQKRALEYFDTYPPRPFLLDGKAARALLDSDGEAVLVSSMDFVSNDVIPDMDMLSRQVLSGFISAADFSCLSSAFRSSPFLVSEEVSSLYSALSVLGTGTACAAGDNIEDFWALRCDGEWSGTEKSTDTSAVTELSGKFVRPVAAPGHNAFGDETGSPRYMYRRREWLGKYKVSGDAEPKDQWRDVDVDGHAFLRLSSTEQVSADTGQTYDNRPLISSLGYLGNEWADWKDRKIRGQWILALYGGCQNTWYQEPYEVTLTGGGTAIRYKSDSWTHMDMYAKLIPVDTREEKLSCELGAAVSENDLSCMLENVCQAMEPGDRRLFYDRLSGVAVEEPGKALRRNGLNCGLSSLEGLWTAMDEAVPGLPNLPVVLSGTAVARSWSGLAACRLVTEFDSPLRGLVP